MISSLSLNDLLELPNVILKTCEKYEEYSELLQDSIILQYYHKNMRKELNKISWNGAAPKYDIRDWAPDHEKMGKGITLTKEEAEKLKELL